ncbi:hypothetical protein DPMN_123968 [Dreissena polymorpha]|uniref:Uncharacterized protein n=1 Tax=Dreissena polymorpha TaxID=45954 RepID=A0A9D4GV99_DREPO|nr:hypothetical protein DPMN_123968 [Dreissena polymorpha]
MNGIIGEIRELGLDIITRYTRYIKTNILTKFHDDWTTNVTSREKEKTNPPPPWRPCFCTDPSIFELNRRIQETNVLTKFHEDWAKNVSSRQLTCFHYIHFEKTAPPPGSHVFPLITTIFKLIRDIHITNATNVTSRETNILTKLHEDWAKMCLLYCSHKIAPLPGGHVFQLITTIFELVRDIYKKNVLTKFHDN